MKFTKTLAAIEAASLAVSTLAVSAFAATITSNSAIDAASDGNADSVIKLYEEDKDHNPVVDLFTDKDVARSDIYGMKVYFDLTADQVNGEEWIGGGIGANSDSTGWLSTEWGQEAGKKPIVLAEDGTVTWLQDTPVFADDDTYCQLWTQAWGIDLTLEKMEVLDKDGNVIVALSDVDGEPADVTPGDSTGEVPNPGDSEPVNPGDCSGNPVSPDTGVAVAVVPAALAAAAVATAGVVLKKRSK